MKKAHLARTAADHRAIGSTVSKILSGKNEGKTLLEAMNDDELREFIQAEIDSVAYMYKEAQGGNPRTIEFFKLTRDEFLLPNLAYLREMGQLPAEFEGFDPETEFVL